jgi:carboxymethylenebutenolidase
MFTDAFGLRPRIEQMCLRLASHGYVVLAPNLFYRHGRAPVVDLGGMATPDGRAAVFEKVRPFIGELTSDVAARDTAASLAALSVDPQVRAAPVGTVGYCMGGRLALRAGAAFPSEVGAVASFHAGALVTDAPDSPHLSFPRLRAVVYVGHADNDASMPPDQQAQVSAALEAAGVSQRTELYADAAHGFTMSDTAAYDAVAEERHWERLLDLFSHHLATP